MEVINAVIEKKLSPQTIEHIRSTMHLLFDEAWRLEIIPENPVLKVKVPPSAYVEKPRVILTDDEVLVFWACEEAAIEIRMLGLVARCEGGMRTRDCTAWDWTIPRLQRDRLEPSGRLPQLSARVPEGALPQPSRGGIATAIATGRRGVEENLSDFGAGHEIRTRDPQLGNLNHGDSAQGFQQVTSLDASRESQQIVVRRDELPRIATGISTGNLPRQASSSRATLLVHLADDLRAAIIDGDLEAARIAHDAIGRLLGSEQARLAVVSEFPNAAASGRASG